MPPVENIKISEIVESSNGSNIWTRIQDVTKMTSFFLGTVSAMFRKQLATDTMYGDKKTIGDDRFD